MTELEHGHIDRLPTSEPFPGVVRASFSSEGATVATYRFEPRASFPLHSHPQEQITLVTDGAIEMTVAGRPLAMRSGDWSIVPADAEHGITAGSEGARVVAIVVPRRRDDDDYSLSGKGSGE